MGFTVYLGPLLVVIMGSLFKNANYVTIVGNPLFTTYPKYGDLIYAPKQQPRKWPFWFPD